MKLCKKGLHQYEGRQCKECVKLWETANKYYRAQVNKEYCMKHKERLHQKRLENRIKKEDHYKTVAKTYRQNNKAKRCAQQCKRQAIKLQATPKWMTKQHFDQIEIFYDAAAKLSKEFGIPMEVDHIMPLRGKDGCGLHVPWNLQVIPKKDNMRKGNRV